MEVTELSVITSLDLAWRAGSWTPSGAGRKCRVYSATPAAEASSSGHAAAAPLSRSTSTDPTRPERLDAGVGEGDVGHEWFSLGQLQPGNRSRDGPFPSGGVDRRTRSRINQLAPQVRGEVFGENRLAIPGGAPVARLTYNLRFGELLDQIDEFLAANSFRGAYPGTVRCDRSPAGRMRTSAATGGRHRNARGVCGHGETGAMGGPMQHRIDGLSPHSRRRRSGRHGAPRVSMDRWPWRSARIAADR